MIESTYHRDVQGDWDQKVNTYTEWTQYFPSDYFPHSELATAYKEVGQWEKSAAEAREAVRLLPTTESYAYLAEAYFALNRLEDAHGVLREAEQHNIDGYLLRQRRYGLAFLERDQESMKEQNAWAAGKPVVEAVQYLLQSSAEAYYGRFARARELTQQAETEFERQQAVELADIAATIHAPAEVEIGRPDIAAKSINSAWTSKAKKSESIEPTVALTLALLGRQAEARIVTNKMDKSAPRDILTGSYIVPVVRAAGELRSDRPLQAIESLRTAASYEFGELNLPPNALYPAYLRGLAHLKAGQGQQAAAEFQKVIDHRGIVLVHIQGALARLGLARAYALEAQTDPAYREKARTAYQSFLTLWKDADPDIPIYKQAKAEYAKLK
jgi:tetratricopeptide (TPR) repeat protein